jgi:hypothetical protein
VLCSRNFVGQLGSLGSLNVDLQAAANAQANVQGIIGGVIAEAKAFAQAVAEAAANNFANVNALAQALANTNANNGFGNATAFALALAQATAARLSSLQAPPLAVTQAKDSGLLGCLGSANSAALDRATSESEGGPFRFGRSFSQAIADAESNAFLRCVGGLSDANAQALANPNALFNFGSAQANARLFDNAQASGLFSCLGSANADALAVATAKGGLGNNNANAAEIAKAQADNLQGCLRNLSLSNTQG